MLLYHCEHDHLRTSSYEHTSHSINTIHHIYTTPHPLTPLHTLHHTPYITHTTHTTLHIPYIYTTYSTHTTLYIPYTTYTILHTARTTLYTPHTIHCTHYTLYTYGTHHITIYYTACTHIIYTLYQTQNVYIDHTHKYISYSHNVAHTTHIHYTTYSKTHTLIRTALQGSVQGTGPIQLHRSPYSGKPRLNYLLLSS